MDIVIPIIFFILAIFLFLFAIFETRDEKEDADEEIMSAKIVLIFLISSKIQKVFKCL